MASPNFSEMQTTTKQNRSGGKKALKKAQAGVPIPSKDFSSEKKEADAAGRSSSTPVPEKKSWETSGEDMMADYRAARRQGKSPEDYEDTARDRISDVAGQRRMDAKEINKDEYPTHEGGHDRGKSAFGNPPKNAHGFGHTSAHKDGHLRKSGHPGAHQLGKKGSK
jgi:hypothetical protein